MRCSAEELGEMALLADALQRAGKLDEALAMAGEVVRGDLSRGEGFLLLAGIHLEREEYEEAREAARRAVLRWQRAASGDAQEFLVEALALEAQVSLLLDDPAAASDPLRALHALAPGDAEWPLLLAECEFRGGKARAALALLKELEPSAASELLAALAYASEGEGERALDAARSAFLREPGLQAWLAACDADEHSATGAAGALLERLEPVFDDLPELLQLLVDLASDPAVAHENAAQATGPCRADLLQPLRLRATRLSLEESPDAS